MLPRWEHRGGARAVTESASTAEAQGITRGIAHSTERHYDRPYHGYEWSQRTGANPDYGGHEFSVVYRSSGTIWPEIEPRANLEHWYSDHARDTWRGAIQLRDPDADRSYRIDGYYMTGKHDFSNGFMAWKI